MIEESERIAGRWDIRAGLTAAVICLVCAELAIAGATRDCLSAFSLEGIYNFTLLWNMLGVPEIMALLSGAPAFMVAAVPRLPQAARWMAYVFGSIVLIVGLLFGTYKSTPGFVIVFAITLIPAGAVIGYWIRTVGLIRRLWFPFGIVLAITLGSVIFATGQYGPVPCVP